MKRSMLVCVDMIPPTLESQFHDEILLQFNLNGEIQMQSEPFGEILKLQLNWQRILMILNFIVKLNCD